MNRQISIPRRAISVVVIVCLRIYTKITGRPRVRVVVTNEFDELLLLRGYVGHGFWSFPGGGLARNESLEAAAVRELHEETGIRVKESDLTYIRGFERPEVDIPFRAELFRTVVSKSSLPAKRFNPREIVEVGWFSKDNLPTPLSTIAREVLRNTK